MSYVSEGRRVSRLIGGTLLLLLGGLFVLQNLGLVRAGHLGDYWPLLLVWVGLCRMLVPGSGRHFASGLVIFLLGVFFQLDRLDLILIPVRHFWPIVLIALGFGLIGDALVGRRARSAIAPDSQPGPGGAS
jgi:membrane-bound ClpP family serine protease